MLSLKAAGVNFELFGMTYLQSQSMSVSTGSLMYNTRAAGPAQAPGVTLVGALPTAVIRTREIKKQESREWAAEVRRLSD